MTAPSGVVVGFDGSPASAAAFAEALEEGARRGECVTAVTAFPAAGSWADDEELRAPCPVVVVPGDGDGDG